MTQPPQQPTPDNDTAVTDDLIESTGNGPQPDDPDEQPSQDPNHLPPGTVTGQQ